MIMATWWGLQCRVRESPPSLLMRVMRAVCTCCCMGGPPPLSPPWWPLALSVHDRLGGPLPSYPIPFLQHAGSLHCWVSSRSSGALPSWSTVAPWPASLPGSSASAGSTAIPIGSSKLYLRCASAPCSGLETSVPAVCLGGFPALPSSAAMPHCGRGAAAVLGPPISLSSPLPSPCTQVARVVAWVSSPPRPHMSSLGALTPAVVTWVVTLGVSLACATRLPRPLPDRNPVGFPPLRRPHGPPPRPPLRGTRGTLERPFGPCRHPALPRFCQTYFPACLRFSPFAPASLHGGPALLPRRSLQRDIS